jgi:hypothetical protein
LFLAVTLAWLLLNLHTNEGDAPAQEMQKAA